MGLATIDLHSHTVQTKLYKIPKFGVNRPSSKQDMSKFVQMAIHFFVNFDVFKWLYLSQN